MVTHRARPRASTSMPKGTESRSSRGSTSSFVSRRPSPITRSKSSSSMPASRRSRSRSDDREGDMNGDITLDRRRFLGGMVTAVAASQLGMMGFAAESVRAADAPARASAGAGKAFFGAVKQVSAGVLNVGYAEAGPSDGPAVILLHGWPYDIHSFVDVAPLLASAGYRVIIPHLRGYGTTRFLSSETFRNGQPSALATDVIALMDALEIRQATLGGFDWGARSADIVAALWPERCQALVAVSGYLIANQEAGKAPLPPKAELQWWYQFYFATERGRAGYEKYRDDFAKLIWQIASPKWNFDD